MSDATQARDPAPRPKSKPELRHEFVGMMFAVAIGEVGLQTATLVQAGHWLHFLPAYSHLFLATVMIATSWVGWTLSRSRGGQKDVQGIFEREFVLLLLDVALVIIYFVLVRAVDFTGEGPIELKASAKPEASWILVIFLVYIIWDVVAKWPLENKEDRMRIGATVICLVLAWVTKHLVQGADSPHVLTADIALLALVLLFRSLKDVSADDARRRKVAVCLSVLFSFGVLLGTVWTSYCLPLPVGIVDAIQTTPN